MGSLFFFPVGGAVAAAAEPASPSAEVTGRQLVTDAMIELMLLNAGDTPSGEDLALGLRWLNRLFDNWNAEGRTQYATVFDPFALTPGLNPHTVGPTGTVTTLQRPQTLEGCVRIRDGIRTPLAIRSASWYRELPDQAFQATPTDVYYNPTWPNGSLHLWPVPDAADSIELTTRGIHAAVLAGTVVSLPPGYIDAVVNTLAEALGAPFRVPVDPTTREKARLGRARAFGENLEVPRLCTRDAGMPGSGGGDFDWRTGLMR